MEDSDNGVKDIIKRQGNESKLERKFRQQLHELGVMPFDAEYRFCAHAVGGPGEGVKKRLKEVGLRDFRFDFAFPDLMLAIEIEGATWVGGRHNRGSGYAADCIKYNFAALLGWRLLRFISNDVHSGEGAVLTKRLTRILLADKTQAASNIYFDLR